MLLHRFKIEPTRYLDREITAFYRADYIRYKAPNNPDYLVILKNNWQKTPWLELAWADTELRHGLEEELQFIIMQSFPQDADVVICTIPRSKKEDYYQPQQRTFRGAIHYTIDRLIKNTAQHASQQTIIDGTHYIIRHTNTLTTHLRNAPSPNDGHEPYPGIAKDTCHFSSAIKGKHVLLIDDVYTKTINIAEDFIQSILDCGCASIVFFAIGRTKLYKDIATDSDSEKAFATDLVMYQFSEEEVRILQDNGDIFVTVEVSPTGIDNEQFEKPREPQSISQWDSRFVPSANPVRTLKYFYSMGMTLNHSENLRFAPPSELLLPQSLLQENNELTPILEGLQHRDFHDLTGNISSLTIIYRVGCWDTSKE